MKYLLCIFIILSYSFSYAQINQQRILNSSLHKPIDTISLLNIPIIINSPFQRPNDTNHPFNIPNFPKSNSINVFDIPDIWTNVKHTPIEPDYSLADLDRDINLDFNMNPSEIKDSLLKEFKHYSSFYNTLKNIQINKNILILNKLSFDTIVAINHKYFVEIERLNDFCIKLEEISEYLIPYMNFAKCTKDYLQHNDVKKLLYDYDYVSCINSSGKWAFSVSMIRAIVYKNEFFDAKENIEQSINLWFRKFNDNERINWLIDKYFSGQAKVDIYKRKELNNFDFNTSTQNKSRVFALKKSTDKDTIEFPLIFSEPKIKYDIPKSDNIFSLKKVYPTKFYPADTLNFLLNTLSKIHDTIYQNLDKYAKIFKVFNDSSIAYINGVKKMLEDSSAMLNSRLENFIIGLADNANEIDTLKNELEVINKKKIDNDNDSLLVIKIKDKFYANKIKLISYKYQRDSLEKEISKIKFNCSIHASINNCTHLALKQEYYSSKLTIKERVDSINKIIYSAFDLQLNLLDSLNTLRGKYNEAKLTLILERIRIANELKSCEFKTEKLPIFIRDAKIEITKLDHRISDLASKKFFLGTDNVKYLWINASKKNIIPDVFSLIKI